MKRKNAKGHRELSVLIVDDELLAREGLRELLVAEPNIHIIGECIDGVEAMEALRAKKPDIVFLDIQMPEVSGFDVVREVGPELMPLVIFVTAYDEFAIRAFDVSALDYLLKPIDPQRFKIALDRARSVCEAKNTLAVSKNLVRLLEDMKIGSGYLERLPVKSSGKITLLNTREIDWIDAEGDYVCVNMLGKKHLIRGRISEMEQRLDPKQFARIHRSIIVNIDRIKELEPLFYGEYSVKLHNGTKLTLSRTYREKLFALLNPA
jgi:two-component system LytT family response regulator